MKAPRLIAAFVLASILPALPAEPINPAVVALKDWLLQKAPDGFDHGMRKSITYRSPGHALADAEGSYAVLQSSAVSRTLKFLSEYYRTYQNDLSAEQRDELYARIQVYARLLLQHRRYAENWGWNLVETAWLDSNLEPDKFYTGAVVTGEEHKFFTGLGNAFACEGLVAAAAVAGLRGDTGSQQTWLSAAKLVGDFLCRLANPYEYYETKFGASCMVDEAGLPIQRPGLVFGSVSSLENLTTDAPLQNLYAIVALKDLAEATGTPSYGDAARQILDAMLPGLRGYNAAFYARFHGDRAQKLLPNPYRDNAWHPLETGQIGDDNIEYSLAALWQYGGVSDLAEIARPFLNLPAHNFPNYDPFISFTGYLKNFDGVWQHQMPYYDMVGFGLLGELRRSLSPADYQRAFTAVVENKIKAGRAADLTFTMLDQDLNPYWASTDEASQSTLVSVAIGLSLMKISPYFKGSETLAPAGGVN